MTSLAPVFALLGHAGKKITLKFTKNRVFNQREKCLQSLAQCDIKLYSGPSFWGYRQYNGLLPLVLDFAITELERFLQTEDKR